MEILVSPEDMHLFLQFQWRVNWRGYLLRSYRDQEKRQRLVHFHREVMNAGPGVVVDHINGNPFDNRRENLRVCSQMENLQNRRTHKNNSLGVKGVYRDRARFRAQINADRRRIRLGTFDTIDAAKAAYDQAAKKLHGEFARLN